MIRQVVCKFKGTVFLRVVSTFFAVLIPIYSIGIYMYRWGEKTVQREIFNSTLNQAVFYLDGLEKEIERLKILQFDCLNDEYLNNLAIRYPIMEKYEIVESMRKLQLRLITINNSSMYAENVVAHIPGINKSISSKSGISELQKDRFENVRASHDSTGAQFIMYNNHFCLSTLRHGLEEAKEPLFVIEIELSNQEFVAALNQFITYEDSGAYFASDQGTVYFSNSKNPKVSIRHLIEANPNLDKDTNGIVSINTGGADYYSVYGYSSYLGFYLIRYLPEEIVLDPLEDFYVWAWVLFVFSLLAIIFFTLFVYKLIHKPIDVLTQAFRKIEIGDLDIEIKGAYRHEFGYLYKNFNEMVKNLKMLIDQVYTQKILTQRAELKHMQSQINPHFLYNSLFTINTMARVGDENLVPFTKYLGEYFRYMTRNASDYVKLQEEIDHARTYTEIQAMRFSKSLTVQFGDCPAEFCDMHVPRLILQPIIENTFEHAVEKRREGAIIRVNFVTEGRMLKITVEDNGTEMTEEKLAALRNQLTQTVSGSEITGMLNVHNRIKVVFEGGSGLKIQRGEMGGTKVSICLYRN